MAALVAGVEGIGKSRSGISAQALQRTRLAHFYAGFAGCGCWLFAGADSGCANGVAQCTKLLWGLVSQSLAAGARPRAGQTSRAAWAAYTNALSWGSFSRSLVWLATFFKNCGGAADISASALQFQSAGCGAGLPFHTSQGG